MRSPDLSTAKASACLQCGGALPPLAERCPRCGAVLAGAAPVAAGTAGAPTLPPVASVASTAATLPPAGAGFSSAPTLPPGVVAPGTETGTRFGAPASGAATLPPAGSTTGGTAPLDTGPLEPGRSFGPRYHIKKLLGLGGMGAVYRAWDTELGIDVAIKLIRPEALTNPGVAAEIQRRFKRELLLARLVTHRNVVRIHDLGEIDRLKYITMSYVDGTDLASILRREGKLPVRRALKIARQVCDGLVAAHAAGVVHRDLKPANVMVGPDDEALLMDFGIAKLATETAPETAATSGPRETAAPVGARYAGMTRLGSMVGTVEYMPPEQARGEPIDRRADVYAFGLMLYDMLAGSARADLAESALAELESRSRSGPPPLAKIAPEVPAALVAVIERCVQVNPTDRFPGSQAVADALARLDDEGKRLPVHRTVGLGPVVAGAAVVIASFAAGVYFLMPAPPPEEKAPVSVLISDLRNTTGDPAFDGTLEPVVKLALENASFVSAFARTDVRRALGVPAPVPFDSAAARALAVQQGLGVVVDGEIARAQNGFRIRLAARQAVAGTEIAVATGVARDRQQVLREAGELVGEIREALGDETDDARQRFALDTLTATSLEVVQHYAVAMDALSSGKFDAALQSFGDAVKIDPGFGLAHGGMAVASNNLGRQQDAERHATEAVRHVDRMTERERFRTRGLYYLVTADYPSCVKEYGALVAKFSADAAARNNLALCSTRLRDIPTALTQMQEAVKILPNRALYRVNTALYLAYAGRFAEAVAEAEKARAMSAFGFVPLGFAHVGLGDFAAAEATFAEFEKVNALGASHAASARADVAAYRGRYAEAVQILERGVAADLKADEQDRAARKLAAIANAELLRGREGSAVAAARRAEKLSPSTRVRFLVARVYAQAGRPTDARRLADVLADDLAPEARAYAKIVEGEVALAAGQSRRAVGVLQEANALLDTWIGRYTLGRAYVEAGAFPQADSEFDRCTSRRGEALALFMDEEPTFALYPELLYWRGRVRQGIGTANFAEPYREYLAIRAEAGEDRLIDEVRRRASGLQR